MEAHVNHKHARKFCILLFVVIVFGITGCAHTPDKSTLQRMTQSDARTVLKDTPSKVSKFKYLGELLTKTEKARMCD
jgi:hypothetical protein